MSMIVTIPNDPTPIETLRAAVNKMQEDAQGVARRHEECVAQLAALSSDLTARQDRIEHFWRVIQDMADQQKKVADYAAEPKSK